MLYGILAIVFLSISAQTAIAQPCVPQGDIEDCYYYLQWHLNNTGQRVTTAGGIAGEDIRIEPVWEKGYKGEGTYAAVVDVDLPVERQSIDMDLMAHPDLIDNISTQHTVDYYPNVIDTDSHATRVAGVIAARDNDIGVRGIAPQAKIYSLNILGGNPNSSTKTVTITDLVDAMTRHSEITAVSNNSWGPVTPFRPLSSRRIAWQRAIETGLEKGFYGKGTAYVWSAGNSRCRSNQANVCNADNANYDNYVNYHAIIAVCAVDDRGKHANYSEFGANLWVCGPSRGSGRNGIVTTTRSTGYTLSFGGTSAAAPMVSGVVALMRQANPELTWRDVKLILANSARQNDPTDDSWEQGAVKYGTFMGDVGGQYHFSHKYGFGVVNAQKAIEWAENWVNLPARAPEAYRQTDIVQVGTSTATSSVLIQSDINFIEFLDIYVALEHNGFYDLSIRLTSPLGRVSKLTEPATESLSFTASGLWRFGSSRHLGEDPSGVWTLTFEDTRNTTGTLIGWGLQVRGYSIEMEATAAEDLSESNVENNPLTLSLLGAKWKQNLLLGDFKLKNAPQGLQITDVMRTSDTQARLMLRLTEGFADDYIFRIEATTGTVSNLSVPLVSTDITITANKPTVVRSITAPDGAVGARYGFTISSDTFDSPEPLTYRLDGLLGSGLTANGLEISGVPTMASTYHVVITAATDDGNSTATSFDLRIRPRGYPIVVAPLPEQLVYISKEFTLNLNDIFSDSDMRSALRYTVSGNPNWLHYDSSTAILSGTPGRANVNGEYRIVIIATDDDGQATDTIINLRVAPVIFLKIKVFLEGALD